MPDANIIWSLCLHWTMSNTKRVSITGGIPFIKVDKCENSTV